MARNAKPRKLRYSILSRPKGFYVVDNLTGNLRGPLATQEVAERIRGELEARNARARRGER